MNRSKKCLFFSNSKNEQKGPDEVVGPGLPAMIGLCLRDLVYTSLFFQTKI